MSRAAYRLPDEPRPGPLSHLAVQPVLPLFAMMLVGGWLAWPWFVLNGQVLGSPTRGRELALALAAVVLCVVVVLAGVALESAGVLARAHLKYWLLWLPAIRLGAAYLLYLWQSRTVGLYLHYGGRLAAAGPLVLLGGFLLDREVTPVLQAAGLLVLAPLG